MTNLSKKYSDILYQFTKSICSVIINSNKTCLVTGTIIEPAFRSYMQNKYSLLIIAKASGYADELVRYYIEKEADMLEYMIRTLCGPSDDLRYENYELQTVPEIVPQLHSKISYGEVQVAAVNIPSIEKMRQYMREGSLELRLNQANELVCILHLLCSLVLTNNNRVIQYCNG
jgi:hypothetical protein